MISIRGGHLDEVAFEGIDEAFGVLGGLDDRRILSRHHLLVLVLDLLYQVVGPHEVDYPHPQSLLTLDHQQRVVYHCLVA